MIEQDRKKTVLENAQPNLKYQALENYTATWLRIRTHYYPYDVLIIIARHILWGNNPQ